METPGSLKRRDGIVLHGRTTITPVARHDHDDRRIYRALGCDTSKIDRIGTGDTGLTLLRHPNRDVVVYHGNYGAVIGPEFDIARELGTVLLPAGGATSPVAELLALVPPSKRRQLAGTLVCMTTGDVVNRVISALK